MFDPDEYELHEAQKYGRKMARERDEARVRADMLTAELAECAAALPGVYYMDPPDGGNVSVSKQLKRMAKDAERLRAENDALREALAHYATDETQDGWIAIAALAAKGAI